MRNDRYELFHRIDNKQIFVAGATGLAGSGIVRALLRASPTVRIVGASRSRLGCLINDPRVRYREVDLRQRRACREAVEGCDWAIAAAAVSGGAAQARAEPWRQVTDNVVLASYLLEALHEAGVSRTILVGSASVYQEFEGFIREDQLDWNCDPHPAYIGVGWAMRYLEKQGLFWHQTTGMDVLSARAANIYGPFAKFDPRVSNFVSALIRKAVEKMDPFEVWGSLDVTRDIVYVDDFADAVLRMLVHTEMTSEVFNIGSGRKTTVGEVVDLALAGADHKPNRINQIGEAATTIPFRAICCDKAKSKLNWSPVIEPDEGIRRTMAWWREQSGSWAR